MLELNPIWLPETQQAQFRLLLEAMARPGRCYSVLKTPAQENAALTILATLLDAEVSLADPHRLLSNDVWPLLQAQPSSPDMADYIVCNAVQAPDFIPKLGTLPSPELSATLVLVVDKLGHGDKQLKLSGPGIEKTVRLVVNGLVSEWLSKHDAWNAAFPLGVDFILVDDNQVTALPRTTKVQVL